MLRDVLMGKQDASLLVMLAPEDRNSLHSCHQWLQMGQGIATACTSGVDTSMFVESSLKSKSSNTHTNTRIRSRSPSPSRAHRDAPAHGSASFRSSTPSAGNYDYASGSHLDSSRLANNNNNNNANANANTSNMNVNMSIPNRSPHSLLPPKKSGYRSSSPSSHSPHTSYKNSTDRGDRDRGRDRTGGGHSNDFTFLEGTSTTINEAKSIRIAADADEVIALKDAVTLKNEQLLQVG